MNSTETGGGTRAVWSLKFNLYVLLYSLKFTFKIAFLRSDDNTTSFSMSRPVSTDAVCPLCPPVRVEDK